jgi:hypothetical protein
VSVAKPWLALRGDDRQDNPHAVPDQRRHDGDYGNAQRDVTEHNSAKRTYGANSLAGVPTEQRGNCLSLRPSVKGPRCALGLRPPLTAVLRYPGLPLSVSVGRVWPRADNTLGVLRARLAFDGVTLEQAVTSPREYRQPPPLAPLEHLPNDLDSHARRAYRSRASALLSGDGDRGQVVRHG